MAFRGKYIVNICIKFSFIGKCINNVCWFVFIINENKRILITKPETNLEEFLKQDLKLL